jgi:ABC-type bacteriocin/lantibiotic exporter with double-glycine peptidase domain
VDESAGEKVNIEGDIEFKNVTFKYPTSKTVALNNLSLKINKG